MDHEPDEEVWVPALTRRADHLLTAERCEWATAHWRALGTTAQVVVTEPAGLTVARHAVETVLREVDLAASRFRPDSEVSELSDGAEHVVSDLLAQAIRIALDAAAWTKGLVDPTVGAALSDWGYDRTFRHVPPNGPAVTLRAASVPGWHGVFLDDSTKRARVPVGTVLDLGATAKGWAADLCADAAAQAAECGVLVNLGGDISLAGAAPAQGWTVEVADNGDPDLPAGLAGSQLVQLRAGALATSSTTARRWRRGGSELHHLIDPRTCAPAVTPWRTASVTAATCALANTAATAAVLLGIAAPSWLRDRGFDARLVSQDGSVTYVGRWPHPAAPT